MFVRVLAIVAPIALGLVTGCAEAVTPPPPIPTPPSETGSAVRYRDTVFASTTVQTDIRYGASIPSGASVPAPLLLDLYAPVGDTASARPTLVWIHGGGFVSGTRTDGQIPRLARAMAQRGYVSVSISYRLRTPAAVTADPMGTIRDAVHDARAAVRWVRANSGALRLDPRRIALVGSSAGGITALFGAYENAWGEGNSGNPGVSSQVTSVVSFWGMLPAGADSVMQAGAVPLLVFHGTADTTVPYTEALELVARAQQVGVPHRLVTLTGQGHAAWNNVPLFEAEMRDFLLARLIP